jgi:NAD(P)-dependent dehydrogenase (short-subunit alcohol dehydrogenase family)
MSPKGLHVLVTGGAGGIGSACALHLARAGAARVSLVDRDRAALDRVVEDVLATGASARAHACDLADPAQWRQAFMAATQDAPIDVLFNNAGVVTGAPLFPTAGPDRIQAIFGVNVLAMIQGTELAAELMPRGSLVVNTISTAHDSVGFRDILYTTSKAAARHFTRAARQLHASHGLRVCGVSPALVATPILDTTGGDRRADWMEPILRDNVALPPDAIAEALLRLIEDDTIVGEVVTVRQGAPFEREAA